MGLAAKSGLRAIAITDHDSVGGIAPALECAEGKGLESMGFKSDGLVGQSAFDLWREMPGVVEDIRRALAGEAFASVVEMAGLVFEAGWSPLRGRNGDVAGTVDLVGSHK